MASKIDLGRFAELKEAAGYKWSSNCGINHSVLLCNWTNWKLIRAMQNTAILSEYLLLFLHSASRNEI